MAIDDVRIETITLKELKLAYDGLSKQFKLTIPRYQRGIVWTAKQREDLIESISKGFPVGALLAYQTNEHTEANAAPLVWQLVDGLQRSSTLIAYLNNPFEIAGLNALVSEEELRGLASQYFKKITHDKLSKTQDILNDWLTQIKKPEVESGFKATELFKTFIDRLQQAEMLEIDPNENIEIISHHIVFLKSIETKIELMTGIQLPIIVYTGSKDNVPEIFELINSQGIKLSKYDTFAATWTDVRVHIGNLEVQDAIKRKYKKLIDAGFEITGVDEIMNGAAAFNLFEYLFGLGKVLSKKYPLLFNESEKDDELYSAAFVIASTCYQLRSNNIARLSVRLGEYQKQDVLDLTNFETALFDTCEKVSKSLRKFLKVKLNKVDGGKRFLPHSELQMQALISRTLIEKYDLNNDWAPRASSQVETLLANIPNYYLLDQIKREWKGSGDSRLWNYCWTVDDQEKLIPAPQYLTKPDKESWVAALNVWHMEELEKQQTQRTSISDDAKLILKYVYSSQISVKDDEDIEFHIEHLYSIKFCSDRIAASASGEGWPISALSNLSLLTKEMNVKKGERLLGDYKGMTAGEQFTKEEWEKAEAWLMHPPLETIRAADTFTKEQFVAFCEDRFEHISGHLLSELGYK